MPTKDKVGLLQRISVLTVIVPPGIFDPLFTAKIFGDSLGLPLVLTEDVAPGKAA